MSAPVQPVVHTPLPWVDDPHDIDGNLKPINTRDKGWTKIRGSNGQCVVGDIDVSTPEGEANLRLILSTHCLLAALRELVTLKNTKPHDYELRKVQAWRAAREAIKEATGEVV
jgi:hypothetical protein